MFRLVITLVLLAGCAEAFAGRVPGPGKKTAHVQGFDVVTYNVKFAPNKPAVVTVVGDGDSPLAVGVFDSKGKPVVVDVKNTDRFELKWTPTSSEPYAIKIKNRGGVPIRFQLKTN
jgi:hypothetical protein